VGHYQALAGTAATAAATQVTGGTAARALQLLPAMAGFFSKWHSSERASWRMVASRSRENLTPAGMRMTE